MEQFQGVPGASQASFDALNTQIANLIKSDTISGTTDGSGNLMIYNGIRNVVSVSISGGYLASPFYYDNKTYIVVANGSFVPQTSKAVTGTYKYV